MKNIDAKLLFQSARDNAWWVFVHSASGLVTLASSIATTVLLTSYLGHQVFDWSHIPLTEPLGRSPQLVIALAAFAALVALATRLAQIVTEAHVTVSREIYFAKFLNDNPDLKPLGNVARASNYYGRMSAAAMKAVSTICVLTTAFLAVVITLGADHLVVSVGGVVLIGLLVMLAMTVMARTISKASTDMALHARPMALWKIAAASDIPIEADTYFSAYFRRLFIPAVFGLTGGFFTLIFCLALFVANEFDLFTINLGEAFVLFFAMQSVVSLFGGLASSMVQGAALLPAVKPFLIGEPAGDRTSAPVDEEFLE